MALSVGETITVPAVAASYHIKVSPGSTVAVAVNVCNGAISHSVISPSDIGAEGAALIVRITAVLVNEGQPFSASA